jgi:glycosyltransferase involved in cell wall biosynthesis
MRIGVDVREIENGVITGIGRSLANFIQYFSDHEKKHALFLFSEKEFNLNSKNGITQIVLGHCPTFLWDQLKLLKAIKYHKIDLFYSPYYKLPLLTSIPAVNQILDLMWLGFPPYKRSLGFVGKLYFATFGKAFAKKSINIITDSEHAKKDIIKFWKIRSEKITTIPLGLSDRYVPVNDLRLLDRIKTKFDLPEKFILYLGNFKPHKNVESLVKAFKKVESRFRKYKLVLAGPLDENGKTIKNMTSDLGLSDKVLFTDTIREKDCPEALLSLAELFVFPTLYEGFGLPPLEAMACGTPVVASNVTSVPEVVGDAGFLVDPTDDEEIGRAIGYLLENPEKREFYSKKGLERAKRFRKKETTEKLYEHIISLLEEGK